MNRNRLFIKFPGPDLGFLAFLKGFTTELWVAVAVFILVVPAFQALSYRVLQFYVGERRSVGYGENVFILFNALSQQGTELEPRRPATRLIFLLMMFSSVFIFENYSASYTSALSVVNMKKPFSSVAELGSKTSFSLGAEQGTAFRTMFEAIRQPTPIQ